MLVEPAVFAPLGRVGARRYALPHPALRRSAISTESSVPPDALPIDRADRVRAVVHPLGDPKFGFLADAFDPRKAAPVLERALGVPILSVRATSFRHHAGRRSLLRLDLETAAGSRRVLGKVRAKRPDRRTQRLMGVLHAGGFDADAADGIAVPEPLAVVDEWRMAVHAWVEAPSATYVLSGSDGVGRLEVVDRMLSALAKLRAARLPVERTHGLDDVLRMLRRELSSTAATAPGLAPRPQRALAACVAIAQRVPPAPNCVAHRAFCPDHVLLAADRTYLVHLDLVALAHPALDVGNLAAHLIEHALRVEGDPHAFDDLLAHVRTRTADVAPPEALEAFTTLSLARLVATSRWGPEDRSTADRLLQVVESRLASA